MITKKVDLEVGLVPELKLYQLLPDISGQHFNDMETLLTRDLISRM